MDLQYLFNNWAKETDHKYQDQQWLLSKWDTLDGVQWSEQKIQILLEHICSRLNVHKDKTLLDLGCGGGWILDHIGHLLKRAVGCDISYEMLKNASGRFPLINANACLMPFKDRSFDRVLCYFVFINFMDMFLVEEALVQIIRILKPGGRALIGQLPDQSKSEQYDQEKKRYLEYCQQHFKISGDTRDTYAIPIQLFDRDFFAKVVKRMGCKCDIIPAFNPFYFNGEAEHVNWRFDVVIEKV